MPEIKTLNEDLFYRGSSANLPRLHTCENKVPFWDFSQFAVTLSFFDGLLLKFFFFHGLAGFCGAWLEGTDYLLVQNSFCFSRTFGDSFNTSCHANCCPETRLCFFPRSCSIRSPVLSRRSLSENCLLHSYFHWWKKLLPFLGFWPIIRPLSPSSSCQAIHLGHDTDLCHPSLSIRVRLWSTDSLTYILYFLQQAGRGVDLHSLFLLLMVSLWGLLIQTQKRWGNFLFLSSQW